MGMISNAIYLVTIWTLPAIIAITFLRLRTALPPIFGRRHGLVAPTYELRLHQAYDPFGTVLMPGMLLLLHSPFVFGYAKPVPVNFRALSRPRGRHGARGGGGSGYELRPGRARGSGLPCRRLSTVACIAMARGNLQIALVINVCLPCSIRFPPPPLDGVGFRSAYSSRTCNARCSTRAVRSADPDRTVHRPPVARNAARTRSQRALHVLASSANTTINEILRVTGNA